MARAKKYACRVCGCTEGRACHVIAQVGKGRTAHTEEIGCWWVKTEPGSPPLCSACSGTEADMAEALKRGVATLKKLTTPDVADAVRIGEAAVKRRRDLARARA